jgi:hypothetical protein
MLAKGSIGDTEAGAVVDRDLLEALAGHQAGRESSVAHRTRRVVSASLGLMQEQKGGRKRTRSIALASLMIAILAVGPFVWRLTDDLIGGEQLSDAATQFSLMICVLCPVLVAAVIVAGWLRRS